MGDKDKMKESFSKLISVPLDVDEDRYNLTVCFFTDIKLITIYKI